jgi:hypothetical protein
VNDRPGSLDSSDRFQARHLASLTHLDEGDQVVRPSTLPRADDPDGGAPTCSVADLSSPHRAGALVFIDETWVKTSMAPLRGWGARGERLIDKAPYDRWRTLTRVAALRCAGRTLLCFLTVRSTARSSSPTSNRS